MKKLVNHLKTEWYKYLLEMLVITAGILGAFALNNWNEHVNRNTLKDNYKESLLLDLQADTARIGIRIRSGLESARETVKLKKRLLSSGVTIDTFIHIANNEFDFLTHDLGNFNSGTYTALIATGHIDLFTTDQHRSLEKLATLQKRALDITPPMFAQYLQSVNDFGMRYPIDYRNVAEAESEVISGLWAETTISQLAPPLLALLGSKIEYEVVLVSSLKQVQEQTIEMLGKLQLNQ